MDCYRLLMRPFWMAIGSRSNNLCQFLTHFVPRLWVSRVSRVFLGRQEKFKSNGHSFSCLWADGPKKPEKPEASMGERCLNPALIPQLAAPIDAIDRRTPKIFCLCSRLRLLPPCTRIFQRCGDFAALSLISRCASPSIWTAMASSLAAPVFSLHHRLHPFACHLE
jgi:hypothetical protein